MRTKGLIFLLLLFLIAVAYFLYMQETKARLRLTFIPGKNIWQYAEMLESRGGWPREEALFWMENREWLEGFQLPMNDRPERQDGVKNSWAEGFLFPETYFVKKGTPIKEVLEKPIFHFKKEWARLKESHALAFQDLFSNYGLKEADVLILASLVEKELGSYEEASRVSGVFMNRLRMGMRLQTDPTLMYRPDRVGQRPSPKERKDRSNPYNTYAIDGLPPGPICSPSKKAILGVLYPEVHDYLFFVARRDGSGKHAFSKTLEGHSEKIERYLRAPQKEP